MNDEEQKRYLQDIKKEIVKSQPKWIKKLKKGKRNNLRALVYDTGDTKIGYGLKWVGPTDAQKNDEIAYYPATVVKCEEKQDYIDYTYGITLQAHKNRTALCARFTPELALEYPTREGLPYTAAFANYGDNGDDNSELYYIPQPISRKKGSKKAFINVKSEKDLKEGDNISLILSATKRIKINSPVLWNYQGNHKF